ncbi:hypothetical protein [Paenibacillus sp. MBLB4367]|uniref:hypothetical protein n=1 Tax=Paenibacillus sp. MBLB4367 TaxID=3384767 RepID=UPI0039083CD5
MYQNPYYSQSYPGHSSSHHQLAMETLTAIDPFVKHGMKEAHATSYPHALREAAAISYLMGKGFGYATAHQIVESWWKMGY